MARKKRRREFGSIRTLPSGRHQAHFTHDDGTRIKAPSTFETLGDAEGWLRTQQRELALGIWVHPELKKAEDERSKLTVGQWVDQFHDLKAADPSVESTTIHNYRNTVRIRLTGKHLLGAVAILRDVPLVDLTKSDVYQWWDALAREFNTPPTNHMAYQRLKAACAAAVDRGLIDVNPVDIKAAVKPKAKNKQLATRAELQAIVDNIYPRYRLLAVLCLFHGLRIGEALAVRTSDVVTTGTVPYAPEVTVRVRENLQEVKNDNGSWSIITKSPKTVAGFRDVPLFSEFIPLLWGHLKNYPPGENGLLSTSGTGQPTSPTGFRARLKTAKRTAGVRMDITPHYGRNWLITELAEQGATPKEIGRIMGQDDVSTIVNTYMKVRESRPAELMRRVGKANGAN